MAASEGPARFECPADFSPCPFSPRPGFSQKTLQRPSKQLWLIRAPANFRPESLDGHTVPLLGSQLLKVPQPEGTQKVYSVQATLGDLDRAHLLIPSSRQDHLACAPSFSGSLSICERYGDPSANQPLFPVAARLAPQIPDGLRQRFLPFGGHPLSPALQDVVEEPQRKRRRKKKCELHTVGYLGAPEEPLPPEPKPCSGGPAGEALGGERSRRPKQGQAHQLLSEQGAQLSSPLEGSSQESHSSGGVTDPSLRGRKKRKQQPQQEEPEELLLEPQEPGPEEPGFRGSPEAAWGAEGQGHCKPKKKKRRRQEEEPATASMNGASLEQEAESGQWDFRGLEGSLGAEEPPPWEQGATWLGPSPVKQDSGAWAEEGTSQKHKKKKKKHKREAAEEESQAS